MKHISQPIIHDGTRPTCVCARKSKRGFTLTEVLVTLVIVTCVGALATTGYNTLIANARSSRVQQCIEAAATLKQAYLNNPLTTDAQRTAWDSATETARLNLLITAGANLNGKPITSGTDLTLGTEQTTITLGSSTTAPTIP